MPKARFWPVLLLAALWGCNDSQPASSTAPDASGDDAAGADAGSPDAAEEVAPAVGCETPVVTTSLGQVALGADGLSQPLSFDVPACAQGFALTITGPNDVTFILKELRGPDGGVLVSDTPDQAVTPLEATFLGPFPGQYLSPERMVQAEGVATLLLPNSSAVSFVPGTYQAVIEGGRLRATSATQVVVDPWQGMVDVELIWKTVDTMAAGGTLDVNFYLTGAGSITAATAPDSALLQSAITELTRIYAQVGIAIGDVHYFDITSTYSTIRTIEGANNELSAMFTLGAGGPPGMNYFLVDTFDIQGLPGGALGGVSGGIPGPPLRPGSVRSGVAVSLAAADGDPAILAHILAHEGGHFLGLFHTQEFFGVTDPLDDTPTGSTSSDNLMYPTVGGDTQLTTEQGQVIHRHAEVAP